ncbi:MAG: type II secretion system protein GspN [Polyangiaceae bacterium]
MKERLKRLAPKLGYPLLYVVCLVVFATWVMPYARLRDRIVAQFNALQKPGAGAQELQIDELSSSWLTGLKAKGVHLFVASSDASKPPAELKVDEAKARVSILSALVGNRSVSFDVDAFDGHVEGSYSERGKDREVEVDIKGIELGQAEILAAMLSVPLEGKLTGTVKITMPEGKAAKGSGNVALELEGAAVGKGKEFELAVPNMGKLALPRLTIGNLTIQAEAKEGILRINKLAAGGKDLDLNGEGRIQMRELATDSIADINLTLKIADAYKTKNDKTKSIFGEPGKSGLLDFDPKVKQMKRPDGSYSVRLAGPLSKMQPMPGTTIPLSGPK